MPQALHMRSPLYRRQEHDDVTPQLAQPGPSSAAERLHLPPDPAVASGPAGQPQVIWKAGQCWQHCSSSLVCITVVVSDLIQGW